LPPEIRKILNKLSISEQVVEDILDLPPAIVEKIINVAETTDGEHARRLAFWALKTGEIDSEKDLELSQMISRGEVNTSAAKAIREKLATSSQTAHEIAEQMNLLQVSDEAELEKIVSQVLADNQAAAQDVKNGEMKAIGFLVGQVMIKSQGQANPQIAQQLIKKQLGL
jgi:Asp-tRNA(Asn)/Glu-tRNA(Gln) amidotransferase B subunit